MDSMTGADLGASTLDELEEAGMTFGPHRRRLHDRIATLRTEGVPPEALGIKVAAAASRSTSDDECTFTFLRADKIRNCRVRSLPSLQTIRREHPDWLVEHKFTMRDACNGSLKKKYSAMSHRWEDPKEPDLTGA